MIEGINQLEKVTKQRRTSNFSIHHKNKVQHINDMEHENVTNIMTPINHKFHKNTPTKNYLALFCCVIYQYWSCFVISQTRFDLVFF